MSNDIEQFYKHHDRLINDKNIENLANNIFRIYGIDFRNKDHYMTFFNSYDFERLSEEQKSEILLLALQMGFNFEHEILMAAKNLVMISNGSKMAQYDLQDILVRKILNDDGFNIDNNGNIHISSVQGDFHFESILKQFANNSYVLEYLFPIPISNYCFSNAIFLLEYLKKGKILFTQIDNGFHTYLHSVYVDDSNKVIDLNYLVSMEYDQFLKLYNPKYVDSIDFELWCRLKSLINCTKKEAILVSYGLIHSSNQLENNNYTQEELSTYLDKSNEFVGNSKLK